MKKWLIVFSLAFALNFVWENLHSILYLHYKQGLISELILIRASLVDAIIITLLIGVLFFLGLLNRFHWLIIITGVIISISIEVWALTSSRWAYSEAMPIIPFIDVGLTPTIQIAITGYLVYYVVFCRSRIR